MFYLFMKGTVERQREPCYVSWMVVLAYPFTSIWQGLNYSDEGNALTIYQLIFTDPASIADTMGYWGGSAVGGLWYLLFGDFGVIGFRVAGALVSVATYVLVYFLLRVIVPERQLLVGLAFSVIATHHFFSLVLLNYNHVSILIFVAAILVLVHGLRGASMVLVGLSGFLFVSNIFVRLPNILGLASVLAVPFYGYKKNWEWRTHGIYLASFGLGAVVAGCCVTVLMNFLGHVPYFLQSLSFLGESVGGEQHGPYQDLLSPVVSGWVRLVKDGLVIGVLLILLVGGVKGLQNYGVPSWLPLVGGGVVFGYFYQLIGIPVAGRLISLLALACLVACGYALSTFKKEESITATIALLILIQLIIWPVGSGAGFVNHIYVLPLALAFAAHVLSRFVKDAFPLVSGEKPERGSFCRDMTGFIAYRKLTHGVLLAIFLVNSFCFIYDESSPRIELRSSVQHPYLRGILLSNNQARSLNGVLSELDRWVKPGGELFVAWTAPILNYLTRTTPYFTHPWSEIYPPSKVEQLLRERISQGRLPVAVKYRSTPYDKMLESFLSRNQYYKVWANEDFEIYLPPVFSAPTKS